MKRITAIILLSCLYFTIMGYHFVFRYQIALAKAQMKNQLLSKKHESDLVHFEFTLNQISRMEWENQHEFLYKGNMYDVVKKVVKNDKIIFICVSDKNETALIEHYLKINRENNSGNRRIADILELSVTPFIPVYFSLPVAPEKKLSRLFCFMNTITHDGIQPVMTPPPEVC